MSAGDSSRVVWQISAGPASRAYADILLKHGVALIGRNFEPAAYANLARLKQSAAELFARIQKS